MEQVLSKVVGSDGKAETAISKARGGELVDKEGLLSPLLDKAKPASEKVLFAPFKEQKQTAAQEGLLSSNEKTGKTGAHEKLSAFINERGGPNINNARQSAVSANQADKVGMLAGADSGRGLKHAVKQARHAFKSETKVVNINQQVTGSTLTEAIDTIEQSQKPAQDFLPTYLVDQVGRQISRALLKADRVIKLQLKPPQLGSVKIEMNIKDNVLRLDMITESSSAKELLLSNVHELKEALIEQGIKIEELDVQVSHDFNHSLANSEDNLKERQKLIQGPDRVTLIAEKNMDDPNSGLQNTALGDHLLNLVA
jgi:flagellar hook-length control protein FliK